jgi:hypothetical protein
MGKTMKRHAACRSGKPAERAVNSENAILKNALIPTANPIKLNIISPMRSLAQLPYILAQIWNFSRLGYDPLDDDILIAMPCRRVVNRSRGDSQFLYMPED